MSKGQDSGGLLGAYFALFGGSSVLVTLITGTYAHWVAFVVGGIVLSWALSAME